MKICQKFLAMCLVVAFGQVRAAETTASPVEPSPGAAYTNIVVGEIPWSIHVVKIERAKNRYRIESRHAGAGALGLETLSAQVHAADTETDEPVAAINGGFYLRDYSQTNPYAGCPRGLQVMNGEVLSAPTGNSTLWLDYAGQPQATEVTSHFEISWPDGQVTPFELNGPRAEDGIELYTPAAGASTHTTGGQEMVLEAPTDGPWPPLRMDRAYSARIRDLRPGGNTCLSSNVMVLSLGPSIAGKFKPVTPGTVVRISTKSVPDLRSAKNAISGGPVIVHHGRAQKVQVAPDAAYELSSMLERHPRTAFGWNDQFFFLVQVDGRQKDLSLGMTLDELAGFLVQLGCTEAMNLDGGGSSSLWFAGKVRNTPCDGYERGIANALVVLQRKDPAKARPAALVHSAAQPEGSARHGD